MKGGGAGLAADAIGLDDVLVRNEEIVHADLGDAVVTLDMEAGRYCELDAVGKCAWELMAETGSVRELRDALVAKYAVDPDTCLNDIEPFILRLAELGMISIERAGAKPFS